MVQSGKKKNDMKTKVAFKISQILRFFFLSVFVLFESLYASGATDADITSVWKDFRNRHPYGYQAVGLRHLGDECVFIISEPAENVSKTDLDELFSMYNGST